MISYNLRFKFMSLIRRGIKAIKYKLNPPKPMRNLECLKCGWVHFAVTRKNAEKEVANFNKYFNTLTKKEQKDYYGGKGSTIKTYERCFKCGGTHKSFIPAKKIPFGSTIQPIISEDS